MRTQRITLNSQRHLVGTGVAENYNPTLIKTVGFFYHYPPVMHDKYPDDKMYRVRSNNLRYCQEKHQELLQACEACEPKGFAFQGVRFTQSLPLLMRLLENAGLFLTAQFHCSFSKQLSREEKFEYEIKITLINAEHIVTVE